MRKNDSKSNSGPQFLRFAIPILDVLRDLGGSGTTSEVYDAVIERVGVSEKEQGVTLKNGTSRVKNQIAWAKIYLDRAGLVVSSKRGVWDLTESGTKAHLTQKDVSRIFREVQEKFSKQKAVTAGDGNEDTDASSEESEEGHRAALRNTLLELPPDGFERLCQRLLRESGFQQVEVTGKSGDGGIDGIGILRMNPLVSFKVLFQCKRYTGSVGPSVVRDFRGAMQGRADKGIILTTGQFTKEARKEAVRDGASPIDLVDGEKLLEMFEDLELGLYPRKTYELDYRFFEQFQ